MHDNKGRFVKGQHPSPATEFKPGQHWRPAQHFRDRDWLQAEYVEKRRSAKEIAGDFGVTENAIFFWLCKHGIPRRSIAETRQVKKWGLSGAANGMYGRRGDESPTWKGGLTPSRQMFYAHAEYRKFARLVHARDRVCRLCSADKKDERLEIHHIDPFWHTPLLALDPANAILLCRACHKRLSGKEMRWRRRLFKLLAEGGDATSGDE